MLSPLAILRRAERRIRKGWIKGQAFVHHRTGVPAKYCLTGACEYNSKGYWAFPAQEAYRAMGFDSRSSALLFNDDDETRKRDVLRRIHGGILTLQD